MKHTEGPLLILAGAGSGKTRVLTHRIAYILDQGLAAPEEVLAITFTNKAAGEMKDRVALLVGPDSRKMWVSTFHAFCARILRVHAEKLGYKRGFTIYDGADQVRLVKRCIVELGCGVGLPTVVALSRGAEVLATDHYVAALDFAAYNARLNVGLEPETALLDWHAPETERLGPFDLVFAADVLYERRNAPALADLIPGLLAPGGEAVFADPRRNDAPPFLELMGERGFENETRVIMVEQAGREVRVLVHRLREG